MEISPAVSATEESFIIYDLAASTRGTAVLTSAGPTVFNLPDVVSNQYQTVFEITYTFEDVGLVEIFGIEAYLFWNVKGNGSTRWQISGDGGSTWVTVTELLNFNYVAFTLIVAAGTGIWLTSINAGLSKFHVRLQALANSGTVSTQLDDRSEFFIQYRKKDRV